ncbi:MAG: hypothetical protein DWB56_11745 [Candidatus Jettenia sp.]|nr:hypothetical protein [Candidatus Jettenia sp.]
MHSYLLKGAVVWKYFNCFVSIKDNWTGEEQTRNNTKPSKYSVLCTLMALWRKITKISYPIH